MNKDILLKIFNNNLLKQKIFNYIKYIHKDIFKHTNTYSWNEIIHSNLDCIHILVGYNYFNILKQYLNNNTIKLYHFNSNCFKLLNNAIIANSLDTIKYLVEILKVDIRFFRDGAELRLSFKYNRFEIVKYLISLDQEKYNQSLYDYTYALSQSPLSNNIEIVKYLDILVRKQLLQKIEGGNNNIIINSRTKEIIWYRPDQATGDIIYPPIEIAIKVGNFELFKWLSLNRSEDLGGCMLYHNAVEYGQFDILRFLHENSYPLNEQTVNIYRPHDDLMDIAVKKNQFEILKYLYNNNIGSYTTRSMYNCASVGSLDMLQWILENELVELDVHVMKFAHSNLNVVKWLTVNNHGRNDVTETLINALSLGSFDVFKWLFEHSDNDIINLVISKLELLEGRVTPKCFDVLKYLFENCDRIHFNRYWLCHLVLCEGSLEFLKWLVDFRQQDFSIEMIRANGYKAMRIAIKSGNLELVQWLTSLCGGVTNMEFWENANFMVEAVNSNNFKVMEWVHQNFTNQECTHKHFINASSNGNLDILIWFNHHYSHHFTAFVMNEAASFGRYELVKWLHENRTEGCTVAAIERAASRGSVRIVDFLYQNRTECKSIPEHIIRSLLSSSFLLIQSWAFYYINQSNNVSNFIHMLKNLNLYGSYQYYLSGIQLFPIEEKPKTNNSNHKDKSLSSFFKKIKSKK